LAHKNPQTIPVFVSALELGHRFSGESLLGILEQRRGIGPS